MIRKDGDDGSFLRGFFTLVPDYGRERWIFIPKECVSSTSYSINWTTERDPIKAWNVLLKAIHKSPEFLISNLKLIRVK